MLIALIANLQNPTQPTKLPTVKIDRGGGGAIWPRYDIVDIVAAAALFPEIAGEDPAARGARRTRWIGQALPHVKEARERREAAAFLTGAQLGAAAEREAQAARAQATAELEAAAIADRLSIEQMIQIVDDVRGIEAAPRLPVPRGRSNSSSGGGGIALAIGLVVGVVIGAAIVGRRGRS